jgi:hypothetical protein
VRQAQQQAAYQQCESLTRLAPAFDLEWLGVSPHRPWLVLHLHLPTVGQVYWLAHC